MVKSKILNKFKSAISLEKKSDENYIINSLRSSMTDIEEYYKNDNYIGFSRQFFIFSDDTISLYLYDLISENDRNHGMINKVFYFSQKAINFSVILSVYDDERSNLVLSNLSLFFSFAIVSQNKKTIENTWKACSYLLNANKISPFNVYRSFYLLFSIAEKYLYGYCEGVIDKKFPEIETIYKKAIEKWDTKNEEEFNKLLIDLADEHVRQSNFNGEFHIETYWIYPYEIIALLSLRKMTGLYVPEKINHPLFELPWVKIPDFDKDYFFKDEFIEKAYRRILDEVESEQRK